MNYYIFRIDYSDRDYFKKNLEKGILRQGWGVENLSLLTESGEIRSQEEWVNAYPESWRTTDEARRYLRNKNNNLRKMLEMKEGDIILIPKFPEWDTFSLYRVSGKYYFDLEKEKGDYGHCIPVEIAKEKPEEIDKYFTYNGNDDTKVVHSKLRGYQTSINSVYNEEIIKAIKNLLQIKSIKEASPITEILRNIFEKNIKNMENLNKEIFSVRPDGIYDEDEGINQLEEIVKTKEKIEEKESKDNNFYKVLVCTGEFSPRVKELAQEKNIILIDGIQLIRMCLKNI